jgi:hypothetical protein
MSQPNPSAHDRQDELGCDHAGDGFEYKQRRRERRVVGRGESRRSACGDQDARTIQ